MRITEHMRAELTEFRAIRRELIDRDVPAVIADALARDAVEEIRNAGTERKRKALRDPDAILASVRAATMRGVG